MSEPSSTLSSNDSVSLNSSDLISDDFSPSGGGDNGVAVEAISERLTEVTELAEELDQALHSAQQDCSILTSSATSTSVSSEPETVISAVSRLAHAMDSSSSELKPPKATEDPKSDEEFVTASESTLQHSRSSSYNTASECEHQRFSPWWEYDKNDLHEDISKEKMVLAVGLPELPPARTVLKPSPEVPPGKIVHEVTETTHIKVQHSHTLGVASYVLTSETVRNKGDEGSRREEVIKITDEHGKEVVIPVQADKNEDVMNRMKECGDWINLKILEITPELTSLGNTLAEALELQKAHDEVLRQLQNKQSPVEELLRQADQLISTQRPRAEVYAAMAESLGRAWKDINELLELRKQILDLNVQYHTKAQEFFQRMDELEESCTDTVVPIEIDAVKNFLSMIHDLRRALLESLMGALQAGNSLLAKLKELGAEGTLDSRPDRIRSSVNRAISQVQGWMDELHIKRQVLEATFMRRKTQLEQCLALAILAADLSELEDIIHDRRDLLASTDQLGDSSSSAELLLHEHMKLLPEAKQLQERALKITKATEQLVASGCFAGEQATEQSYAVLSTTSDYLADLQSRENLLQRVIAFFKSAQSALNKLDQLEIQLTTSELPSTSPQLAQLHAQCAKTIEDITSAPIAEGYSILDSGVQAGLEGVRRMVEELENKKISLDRLCVAHKEENMRINKALNNFFQRQQEIYSWLVSIAEAFLQGHPDMGRDSQSARDFLDLHNRLLNDLQTKGNEINALLLTVPPILEYLEDNQRRDVDSKVEELHGRWMSLKNLLENRLDLARIYLKFHMEADIVNREMDNVENSLRQNKDNVTDQVLRDVEEKWESLIPLYQSAKNTGLTFINQAEKVSEPHLDTKRARSCVESVLERLAGRQLVVTKNWQTFSTEITEKRELLVRLEETMAESTKTINWVTKLDEQLYPIITTHATNPKEIAAFLQQKSEKVLPDIKKAQAEVEQRISTAEALIAKAQATDEKTLVVKNKLSQLKEKLSDITKDYQVLLELLIAYFNGLVALGNTVDELNDKFSKNPEVIERVEALINEHEASKQGVLELFKRAQIECERITQRINKQEPPQAAQHDIEKLQHVLELQKDNWEKQWTQRRDSLEAHRQLCQFDTDLSQINDTLDDLGRQLEGVKGQYGESLAAAKATSHAFVYFEKTVELLEQRIRAFLDTAAKLLDQRHAQSPHIQRHVAQLQERWNNFKSQVKDTRDLIDLSIKFFELVDEANEWFREGNKLLVAIARKSTMINTPDQAQVLLDEIEIFLKPGEQKQNERIQQIIELASKIFGPQQLPQIDQVLQENRGLMESFSSVSNELNALSQNLKQAEEERERQRIEAEAAAKRAAEEEARRKAEEEAARLRAAEEAKRRAEEEAKRAEEARIKAEEEARKAEEARLKAEEEARLKAEAEAKRLAEEARLKAEVEAKRKAEEEAARLKAEEDAARLKAEEAARLKAEEEAKRKAAEEAAAKAQAAQLAEEQARQQAELLRIQEQSQKVIVHEIQKEPTPEPVIIEEIEAPVFTSPLSDAVIQEGSKFTFLCHVSGTPVPVVTWFKDGISIQNNPDYQTTFDQGLCTLTIEETFAEDSAKYTCKAINAAGAAETTASLSVKETEPEEQLLPPTFVKLLEPGVAREGLPFQFQCKVEGNPLPTVQWFKNNDCIDSSPDYVITYNNGDAILKFEKISLEDKAEYTCKANNQMGMAQSTANLQVSPLEPTESPKFILPLSNVMARAGQKIKLECEVSGLPPPILTWSHNGKAVKETRELKLQFEGNKATLVVFEAFPKDAGTYQVNAKNIAGEASSASTVSVKGRLPTETSDSELASDMEPVKPSIQLPLTNISVQEGNRVRLDCVIVGQPEPEVIWYHDDRPVKESPDFQLLFQGDRCSLIIQEAFSEDAGEYKVVALNSAGEASSKCTLSVVSDSTKPPEEEKPGNAPKFVKLLSDVLVSEGDKVIFEGNCVGEPKPEIKWLLNNQPITAEHVKISHDEDGTIKLEIDQVRPEDKGVYTVKATNSAGDAKCFAQLIVKSIKPPETVKHEEVKSPPVFKEMFNDRVAFEQTSTKFECIVYGKPTPKIKWLFNGEPIAGNQFLISTSGDRQVLTIPELTTELQGTITCVAENEAGKASCAAMLSVQSSQDITLPETSRDIQQHVESSYIINKQIHMESSTSTSSKITSQTGTDEPQVQVHSFSAKDQQTIKQVNQEPPQISHERKVEEYHEGTPTKQIIQSKPKTRPPKFVTPVIGKIIDQNVDVLLEGILDGQPTPEVTWTKNGQELKNKEGLKVHFELNRATVEIKNANIEDAGRYTCTAVNEAGKAVSTADLVVRKTVFPPVFGRRLQAQVIKKGDRVIMEVEVTGTPDPTVTWFKDGVPIEEALKDQVRVKSLGNSHSLIIEKADMNLTGRFMVRAVNSGGEAQSIADIAVYEPAPDTMVEVVKTVVFEDVRKHETLTSAADKVISTVSAPAAKPQEIPRLQDIAKPQVPSQIPFSSSKTEYSSVSQQVQAPSQIPFSSSKSEYSSVSQQVQAPSQIPFSSSKSEYSSVSQQVQAPSQIPFSSSKSEYSTMSQQMISKEMKTVRMEHTAPEIPMPKPIQREIDFQLCYTQPQSVEEQKQLEETGIETSSISKESSMQYFVKKIEQGEEPVQVSAPKEVPVPIKPEIYKKFEEVKTEEVKIPVRIEQPLPKAPLPSFIQPKPVAPPVIAPPVVVAPPVFQPLPPLTQEFSQYSREEFVLRPEPPAEICYTTPTSQSSVQSSSFEKMEKKSFYSKESSFMAPPQVERPASATFGSIERQHVQRPLSAQGIEPSPEAIAMEKAWAHKFSEHHVEKSWPPPMEEPPKVQPSWSVQSTLEKKWTPEVKTEKIIRESTRIIESAPVQHYFKETRTVIETPQVPLHYIATVSDMGTSVNQIETTRKVEEYSSFGNKQEIYEERNLKPSQKSWPPPKPSIDMLPIRPVSVQDITDEVVLEPGPPPEIGFIPAPRETKSSYVEMVEHDLEKRVPVRVPPCGIRTIPPPPLPPKKEQPIAPPIPAKPVKVAPTMKPMREVPSVPFQRFPDLEPFPFRPDPEKPKGPRVGPPPTPSRFVKGRFTDSDYESDFESVRIPPKWKPCASDNEEPSYRRVRAPKGGFARSRSVEPEPLPPCRFERPLELSGSIRPEIDFESVRKQQQVKKQVKHYQRHEVKAPPPPQAYVPQPRPQPRPQPQPVIKPGSPPIFAEAKAPIKPRTDGYMADTDEPFIQQQKKMFSRHEEYSKVTKSYESSSSVVQPPKIQAQPKFPQHKKHVSSSVSSLKKEFVATPIVTSTTIEQKLEPFPFKPEQPRGHKPRGPPPPSPSKFVKGEFRESDYESEYEGRIPPVWRGDTTPGFKPVHPVLTPTTPSYISGRTPTPPTEFDRPPTLEGPPRPKFEPIEKFKPSIKRDEIFQPAVCKPKPVIPTTDMIIATPGIKPGSPPEFSYAPGPHKTQYYRSTTSQPYHNAVQTETSNVMHFNESSQNCHRTMSLQQTTKVIKFGEKGEKLEPFPYKAEPERPRIKAPPPPTPTKFIPGEFRESEYESEVESARINQKWGHDSASHFRHVRAPAASRSSSVPGPRERVLTPMEFDQPPVMPFKVDVTDGETRRHEMTSYKKFSDTKQVMNRSRSYEPPAPRLHPEPPPQYGFAGDKQLTRSTATKMASQHMDSMTQAFRSKTQNFARDIMGDMKKPAPPVKDGEAQVYREESRAAQYGTKHVDPDTGLIYFKYDFGYEFGIILPGESKQPQEIPVPKKTIIEPPKRTADIQMPVYHETTQKNGYPAPKKTGTKNVKWEPTSESEMSEYEGEHRKRGGGLLQAGSRWDQSSCSPASLSPSLPSTSPAFNSTFAGRKGAETPPSCPSTPGSTHGKRNSAQAQAPMFITPLRDIAVVSGQAAKFECIVQSEPAPNILWSKNGRIIENSNDHQLHYRNGVCRLTISQAYPEDAGTYSCTASNPAGTANTTATLQVPGERRSAYL